MQMTYENSGRPCSIFLNFTWIVIVRLPLHGRSPARRTMTLWKRVNCSRFKQQIVFRMYVSRFEAPNIRTIYGHFEKFVREAEAAEQCLYVIC